MLNIILCNPYNTQYTCPDILLYKYCRTPRGWCSRTYCGIYYNMSDRVPQHHIQGDQSNVIITCNIIRKSVLTFSN